MILIMVPTFWVQIALVISLGFFGPVFRPSCRPRHAGSGGLREALRCVDAPPIPVTLGSSNPTQPTYPSLPTLIICLITVRRLRSST